MTKTGGVLRKEIFLDCNQIRISNVAQTEQFCIEMGKTTQIDPEIKS